MPRQIQFARKGISATRFHRSNCNPLRIPVEFAQENYGNWRLLLQSSINTKASGANVPGGGWPFSPAGAAYFFQFSFAHALASGGDLRFADTTGKHLPYQLETLELQ